MVAVPKHYLADLVLVCVFLVSRPDFLPFLQHVRGGSTNTLRL
jgi:hypothetical protein